jgi:molybdenum cofactor cytidylyltransferase
MINAIILAAGESKRMGKPKSLLRFEDKTFLEQIISVLQRSLVDKVTIVLGAKAETIQRSIDLSGMDMVINKDYRKGQLSSLIAGLEKIPPETEAILVCLVDNPFITTTIVDRIIGTFRQTKGAIVVPAFNNKRGHPALFAKSLFKEIVNAPAEEGARSVVYSNEDKLVEVETSERAVLVHIDTPEDYRSYFGTGP